MSDKNSTFPHYHNQSKGETNIDSVYSTLSTTLLKRRFSATKMLNKAKDTTKSLVHDVLEKRHSIDSKRSNTESPTSDGRSVSLTSVEKLKMPTNLSNNEQLNDQGSIARTLSSRTKHYSLPLKRPFTVRKEKADKSAESSLSSFSSSSSNPLTDAESPVQAPLNAAAAAEADVLSGGDRPGSFATACDFRLANDKKNEEFHALFKSVQESDLLIQDYKCALQKDILLQGHLFISEHHVCFKSNIFGWVTNLVINFDEIIEVEKKMTAKIIPNGITIVTGSSKHIFASLLSRDQTYDQIVKIWDLRKKINSVIPITTPTDDDSLYEEGDTEEEDDDNSIISTDSAVILKREITPSQDNKSSPTIPVALPERPITPAVNNSIKETPKQRPRSVSDSNYYRAITTILPESRREVSPLCNQTITQNTTTMTPVLKKTRVCPCTVNGEQYPHIALNETYHGSVNTMFRLLFDSNFFTGFLERYQNFEHVQSSVWKHGKRQVVGQRRIKSSTTGTKVVKILFEEKRIHRKVPYYTCVTAKKSMPDMPMGAVYSIQSRTCITRVSKDKVHILVTFQVVFSKTGLVSSIIEKNAADDQLRLYSQLNSILNKPDLIKELVNDKQLLQDLNLAGKAASSHVKTKKQTPKGWVSYAMDRIGSTRLIGFVYFGFFMVLVTHCILALRLKRITHTLELVQQNKPQHHQPHNEMGQSKWINNKIDRVHQRLDELKNEVHDYSQRITNLNNVQ